ncbi:hypothetical protein [Kitasatospora kifunensis]|uniref:Uncharacterized protein n=1 Tax=Kitasatospora kifunensis TaxID=58351 RepID=A0A7W7RBU6_KITKI|nr:hypothetical protein [Kitasatospora kifunensis]MBB4929106.1 hypothetical protein [Kitasatospora kifunensis]
MTYTVAHIIVTRQGLSPLAEAPRSSELLVQWAADGDYTPGLWTLAFDRDADELCGLAARYAAGKYLAARFDAIAARVSVQPRDVQVSFLGTDGRVLCTATAEDDQQAVLDELERVADEIERLEAVRTSLLQRGHDLSASDRRLAGCSGLGEEEVTGRRSGARPVHRLQGDALRALNDAGIATPETVLVHSRSVEEIEEGKSAPAWGIPHVRVFVHACGELRMEGGRGTTLEVARDSEALLQEAIAVVGAAPGLTVTVRAGGDHWFGAMQVERYSCLITEGH